MFSDLRKFLIILQMLADEIGKGGFGKFPLELDLVDVSCHEWKSNGAGARAGFHDIIANV